MSKGSQVSIVPRQWFSKRKGVPGAGTEEVGLGGSGGGHGEAVGRCVLLCDE